MILPADASLDILAQVHVRALGTKEEKCCPQMTWIKARYGPGEASNPCRADTKAHRRHALEGLVQQKTEIGLDLRAFPGHTRIVTWSRRGNAGLVAGG